MLIKSENNEFIKSIKKLNLKKERYKKNLFYIEGKNNVLEAIKSGANIKYIVISDTFSDTINFGSKEVIVVKDNVYKKLSNTVSPQMIMAIIQIPKHDIKDVINKYGIYIITDNVQDPGNLGTIIRSADAFNVKALFTINNTVDIYNPKVLRSTMGSIFHIPVINILDVDNLMNNLRNNNIQILSTSLNAGKYINEYDISKNTAFIFGNESKGVNEELNRYIDDSVKIPMEGKSESLNVSIAVSICLYESERQRLIK